MAAPAFRAKTTYAESKATKRTLVVPATSVAGDALIVAFQLAAKLAIAAPVGWLQIAAQLQSPAETITVSAWVLPNWNGSTTEHTFEWDGTEKFSNAFIASFSGCDTSMPIAVVSNAAIKEVAKSTKAIIDAYTTASAENRPIQLLYNNEGRAATPPIGYTEFADQVAGPAGNYKTASVEAGEVPKNEITVSEQISWTLGFALQPPQAAMTSPLPGSLDLLGVGR